MLSRMPSNPIKPKLASTARARGTRTRIPAVRERNTAEVMTKITAAICRMFRSFSWTMVSVRAAVSARSPPKPILILGPNWAGRVALSLLISSWV